MVTHKHTPVSTPMTAEPAPKEPDSNHQKTAQLATITTQQRKTSKATKNQQKHQPWHPPTEPVVAEDHAETRSQTNRLLPAKTTTQKNLQLTSYTRIHTHRRHH